MPDRNSAREIEQSIMGQLHEAGYDFVLEEQHANDRRFDFVAYAPDRAGRLKPHAVVEVKHVSRPGLQERALDTLAYARELLGTEKHYYVEGGRWFLADAGLRHFAPIVRPESVDSHDGVVADDSLLDQLLSRMLWQLADAERDRNADGLTQALLMTLRRLEPSGMLHLSDQDVRADRSQLWHAANRLARRVLETSGRADLFTPQHVTDVMVRMLGEPRGTVGDPFCGTGLLLAEVAEHAQVLNAEFYGQDINPIVVGIAEALAHLARAQMSVEQRDSLAGPVRSANLIISAPPWGLRLGERYELLSGESTIDGDVAVIDACLRALVPGGRAVMLLPRGWTFRGGVAERYRAWLSQHSRVAALVGLPAGALTTVHIPVLVLVLESTQPSATFVAQLEADWQDQLSADGTVMRALQAHLNGPGAHDTRLS